MRFLQFKIIPIIIFLGLCCTNKRSMNIMSNELLIEDIIVGEGDEANDFNKVLILAKESKKLLFTYTLLKEF